MLIVDIPRKAPTSGGYVEIPPYHRAHLGLTPNTYLSACLLPGQISDHNPTPLPELIVSPFDFDRWDKLWRLTASLHDRPGHLHEISQALFGYGVDIMAAETGTIEGQGLCHVEMILFIRDPEQLPAIRWTLGALCIEDVAFMPDGSPRLKLLPLNSLWAAKDTYDTLSRLNNRTGQDLKRGPVKAQLRVELAPERRGEARGFRLRLERTIKEILRNTVREATEGHKDWGYQLRLSDTKDRFLRVLFFRNSDTVIHARIQHVDHPGALAAITGALRADFNILSAIGTQIIPERNRAWLDIVVRARAVFGAATEQIKSQLEQALASSHQCSDLEIKIGYPGTYLDPFSGTALSPLDDSGVHETPSPADLVPALVTSLESKRRVLTQTLQDHLLSNRHLHKWNLLTHLSSEYEHLTGRPQSKALFVSCHFRGSAMDKIKRAAESKGFQVITGEHLEAYPTQIEGLLEKIRSCTHFLGVWSLLGAQRCGEDYWPSPWLLWELGVAEALKLQWMLQISKQINQSAWSKISPARQHFLYEEGSFEEKLDQVLDILWQKPIGMTM